jgi:hypothetical protein
MAADPDVDPILAERAPLNRWAIAGLAVSVFVAAAALFVLPWLQSQGVSFGLGFWSIVAVEFLAALATAFFALNLHGDPDEP